MTTPLPALLATPLELREAAIFDRLAHLDNAERYSYAERGLLCCHVQNQLLHNERTDPATGQPCSFTRWVRLACPWGYSTSFEAMRDVEALSDMKVEDLAEIPTSNFGTIKQLSTAVRNDPQVLEVAKNERTGKLVEYVRQNHPDQHLEVKKTIRFTVSGEVAADIQSAVDVAMEKFECGRGEALGYLAAEALRQWKEEEEK